MTAHPIAALNSPASTTAAKPPRPAHRFDRQAGSLVRFVIKQRFAHDPEFLHATHQMANAPGEELTDFLFAGGDDPHTPEEVFDRLRWGGQFVYVSHDWSQIVHAVQQFAEWQGARGWALERRPITLKKYPLGVRLLGFPRLVHYFSARKVLLVPPGQSSDRFTYNVYLEKHRDPEVIGTIGPTPALAWQDQYDVVKAVPTTERVLARLKEKFPDADGETLKRRAKKFTEKIFPVFLTREAAILKLLQRDLPPEFRNRVPHVITADQDPKGYVQNLRMNWLRNGGKPLSQLEFAKQAAELLTALHDQAKIMHLDLRLDNVVITEHGVGFVDFGSAVRVGEAFPEASLLGNLFGEMMRTSQIQRMLGKMTETGQVTSEEICRSYHKIDKAVDFFYLAVQINAPTMNPDFRGLVKYDPNSREAKELARLTDAILRPADPEKPAFKSASDILAGIKEIERTLKSH